VLRFCLILLFITTLSCCATAQAARFAPNFHPGTYSKQFADVLAAASNPAALTYIKAFTAGACTERRFMLQALQSGMVSAAFPLFRNNVAGIHLHHSGGGAFVQSEAGLAYAKDLGKASLGIRFSYYSTAVQGYGKANAFLVDVGSAWQLTDHVQAGLALCSPAGGKLGGHGEKVAYKYTAGLGWELSPQLLLAAECSKTEDKPIDIRCALQYAPTRSCMLQFGIATANAKPFAAVSLQWNQWRIYMNVSYHARLGFSPAFALLFVQPSKDKSL
jgi:hypothetical protein